MTRGSYPDDIIANRLSALSGMPPDAHRGDAKGILLAALFQIQKPKAARGRAERMDHAALLRELGHEAEATELEAIARHIGPAAPGRARRRKRAGKAGG